jgi:hypothetical protein
MSESKSEKQVSNVKYCRCCGKVKKIECNTCGKKKKPDQFHVGKKICKDCRSQYNKEKYQTKKAKKPIAQNDEIVDGVDPCAQQFLEAVGTDGKVYQLHYD